MPAGVWVPVAPTPERPRGSIAAGGSFSDGRGHRTWKVRRTRDRPSGAGGPATGARYFDWDDNGGPRSRLRCGGSAGDVVPKATSDAAGTPGQCRSMGATAEWRNGWYNAGGERDYRLRLPAPERAATDSAVTGSAAIGVGGYDPRNANRWRGRHRRQPVDPDRREAETAALPTTFWPAGGTRSRR